MQYQSKEETMPGIEGIGGLVPFEEEILVAGTAAPSEGAVHWKTTLKQSDQGAIDDIIAMLPKSWLDPIVALNLLHTMSTRFGIDSISSRDAASEMSTSQGAILLSALDSWSKSQQADGELIAKDQKKRDTNPILTALQSYIVHEGEGSTVNPLQSLQFLRSSPILTSALQTVDSSTFLKAYHLAEAQIIVAILDKWSEQQALLAAQYRERVRREELYQTSPHTMLVQEYMQDVKNGKQELSQPVFSLVAASVMGGAAVQIPVLIDPITHTVIIDASKDSILPVGSNVFTGFSERLGVPAVAAELAQIAANATFAAAYWAVPGTLSLIPGEGIETTDVTSKAAIQSYAITIAQFTLQPEFEAFIKSRILKHVDIEKVPAERIESFIALTKIMLLSNALASLDKMSTGGIVIRAQDFMDLINGKIKLDDGDSRLALVKLINEQLGILSPTDKDSLKGLLATYFDTNPDLEVLTDPSKAFLAISDPTLSRQTIAEQRG